jgi:pre-rRNA-processing protein TSR2
VETVLLQVMLDEFEVAVDDDSAYDVAERIVRIRTQCERGDFAEVVAMREEWARRGGREVGVSGLRVEEEEVSGEESSEEESEEEDVEMEEAEAPRERRAPEIDEEGFQTVVSRKKR